VSFATTSLRTQRAGFQALRSPDLS